MCFIFNCFLRFRYSRRYIVNNANNKKDLNVLYIYISTVLNNHIGGLAILDRLTTRTVLYPCAVHPSFLPSFLSYDPRMIDRVWEFLFFFLSLLLLLVSLFFIFFLIYLIIESFFFHVFVNLINNCVFFF